MLTIGSILQGRYRIVHPLGQGGMGAVYKAIDERLNKTVAIKEVLFDFENAADEHQRNSLQKAFQREANSLVKAKHENVPDITDFFSELESSFLVMEYIEGDDLAKMLEKRAQPFSFEEVAPWIDQLLEALNYLHNLTPPILHRDIKPQNLKLNERRKIKLLDFGIARSADKDSTLSQHTFLAATLNYAPFEQVLRAIAPTFREFILLTHRDKAEKFLEQDTDARCDVFGVGATFYHLLTNQIPAEVTKRALGIWETGTDDLVDPSGINPEIPPGVSAWLLKAMAFEREDRFASASEMKEALDKITAENRERPSMIGLTGARQEETPMTLEQQLMLAKTERLIDLSSVKEEISSPDVDPSPTGPTVPIAPTEAFTSRDPALTDFNTDFSVQATAANLTGQPFVDKDIDEEPPPVRPLETQDVEVIPPQTNGSANNTRKYIKALAVIGILVLAVSGIGLYAVASLMKGTPEPENKTIVEDTNVAQTPEPTQSVQDGAITTEGIAESNTETNPNNERKETQETPTTVAHPTVSPTGKTVVDSTPKPTPVVRPTVNRTPQNSLRYVLCYVKSSDGTVNKIRKNSCSECPPKTTCELIID